MEKKGFSITCARIAQDHCSLTEVSEHERRHHKRRPGQADRLDSKVAHIRIQRLAAGYGQNHGAEDEQAVRAVSNEESDAVMRRKSAQDLWLLKDVVDAKARHRDEPHEHHRAKELADITGSAPLDREEPEQYGARERQHDR